MRRRSTRKGMVRKTSRKAYMPKRKNAPSSKGIAALATNRRLREKVKKMGYRGKSMKTKDLQAWLAKNSAKKQKRDAALKVVGKQVASTARRRQAKQTRAVERKKADVRVSRARNSTTLGMLKRRKNTLENQAKRLSPRIEKLNAELARKNASMHPAVHGTLGFVGGFAIEAGLAGGLRKIEALNKGMMPKLVEIGVPVIGSTATYFAHKKGMGPVRDPAVAYGIIGGMIASAVVRNVPMIREKLASVPVLGTLVSFGQEAGGAFGEYYAGAAGMGRYLTSTALGDYDYADDLYAGQAGVGRYVSEPPVLDGLGGAHDLAAGAAGVGRYMLDDTAFQNSGMSGMHQGMEHDDDMDDLMDELGAVPHLTPDEEQAENILIPELAYEALQGLHGGLGQDPKATLRARSQAPVIRATPGIAAKLNAYNIGEVIGESQQVPGTVLVATSVAGRDVNQGAGAMIPTQKTAFKNPGIQPAGNVTTEPYGAFSRGIFSSTLPVHGQISR